MFIKKFGRDNLSSYLSSPKHHDERNPMKSAISTIIIIIFLSSVPLSAQTNVDKLAQTLDSLCLVSFNNWKVSPDLKSLKDLGDQPAKFGFDDSKWDNLNINASVYPDSCWIRKEITLPVKYLGQPISGIIKFLVSVDDYGYLWVNGESKGYFPWDGEFELTKNAQPGQKFLIAIKAINTGGPLRLLRAEMRPENTSSQVQGIQDFSLSLQVAQKLLSFDTYQTNARKKEDPKTDKSKMDRYQKASLQQLLQLLAAEVDVNALSSGAMDRFNSSLNNVRTKLEPVKAFVKRFTLFFDANAHIDAAWLWRDKETIEVCKNTFSSVFNMMTARPEFTYTQSSAAYYDWMERYYPDVFKGIQKRISEGRWEVAGGMWVEPDCNLPSGESWARHLLYAKKYFKNKFGVTVKFGWNPDSFGYNWNMPMFYTNAGIDAFITQKIGWNDTNVFPYRLFWWEGADSSKILTYFPFDYVNTVDDPFRLVDWLRQFEANTGFTKLMILFGVGDHGGGPSIEMLDRIKRLATLDIFPTLEYGTTTQYLDWLKQQDLSGIPTWNDELYLEYHQGTYTTQAKMKEYNRRSEVLLTNAEKFSSIATMYGRIYNNSDLEEAWHNVLFNQFHDILPGSGIRENYIDATEKYTQSEQIGVHELDASLKQIIKNINTASMTKGIPVVVANPLAWARKDIVTVRLPEGDQQFYTVFGSNGIEVPSQIIQNDRYHSEIMFIAENIPALGYSTFELRRQPPPSVEAVNLSNTSIENNRFKITLDPDSGWIKSIFDKQNGKEILSGYGNELQLLEDKPSAWDAWNIGLTGVKYPSKLRTIEVVEHGPVRVVLRITRDYLKPGVTKDFPTEDFPSSFFTQDIILYNNLDRIDFETGVDWWEDKTMLKVAFPLTVSDTVATYEIPYGTITRSTRMESSWEKAKVEVPAQRWADLSQHDYGVSLLNKSKYGYDIKGNTMRLSLLRSPKWPDATADRGKHSIEYSLYPHAGRLDAAAVTRLGYEYNNPLIAILNDNHKGALPASKSFIQLEPSDLVITTVKQAEDNKAWIIQWYETKGENTEAVLTLPKNPKKVMMTNFLEEDGSVVSVKNNIVKIPVKKNSVQTIKIYF